MDAKLRQEASSGYNACLHTCLKMAVHSNASNRDKPDAIETVCTSLCETLEAEAYSEKTFWGLTETWTREFDMGVALEKDSILHDGHVFGEALTVYAYHTFAQKLKCFDLQATLDTFASIVCIHDTPLTEMSWQQTQDVIMSLQIEFIKLFVYVPQEGFGAYVDIYTILSMLLAQIGFFASHKWKQTDTPRKETTNQMSESVQVLHGVVDVDAEGWEHVREESMVFVLDALHSMTNATNLLLSAQDIETCSAHMPKAPGEGSIPNFLFNHHMEASLDDFYDLSMVADCPIGSILQYKHKFRYLFHSVAQVIFFHYPAYARQKQIPLAQLQAANTAHVNVLPLLSQVKTDIPILMEHTGLGTRVKHTATAWSWAVVGPFALLLNRNLEVFCAQDLRILLLYAEPDILTTLD